MKFLNEIDGAHRLKTDNSNQLVTLAQKNLWGTVVDKVDNNRVLTDVPVNAKFTDTVFDDTEVVKRNYSVLEATSFVLPLDADLLGGQPPSFYLTGGGAGTSTGAVDSVNGKVGDVTLRGTDILVGGLGSVGSSTLQTATQNIHDLVTSLSQTVAALNKASVGLSLVDNIKQMPISGGTFTNAVKAANSANNTSQMRNVTFSTEDAVLNQMQDGEMWIKYE